MVVIIKVSIYSEVGMTVKYQHIGFASNLGRTNLYVSTVKTHPLFFCVGRVIEVVYQPEGRAPCVNI